MTKKVIVFPLEGDGRTVAVEVEATPAEAERIANAGELVEKAGQSFSAALETAQVAASTILSSFATTLRPDNLEMEFGLKFSSKAGVVIASADAQATLKLKAVWSKPENGPKT